MPKKKVDKSPERLETLEEKESNLIDVSRIKRPVLTEEEVKTCIQIGRDDGSITASERDMLSRIFTLNDKTVQQVMVPKAKMATINAD